MAPDAVSTTDRLRPSPPGLSQVGNAAAVDPGGPWAVSKVPTGDSITNLDALWDNTKRGLTEGATIEVPVKAPVVVTPTMACVLTVVVSGVPCSTNAFMNTRFYPPAGSGGPVSTVTKAPLRGGGVRVVAATTVLIATIEGGAPYVTFSQGLFGLVWLYRSGRLFRLYGLVLPSRI